MFPLLRERGKKTEEKMFVATGGVNTHKGIIFTIGILAAAAGISLVKKMVPEYQYEGEKQG